MKLATPRCIFAIALAAATPLSAQSPHPPAPDYGSFKQSYQLPYAQAVDFQHLDKTLKVRAQINGGPVGEFTVDTGSVGIVVGADDVPNIDPHAKAGELRYSSSGLELHGVWTTATVTFPDAHGVATAVVPVLAVTSSVCTGSGINASGCHSSDHPKIHMMGVGFGRGEEGHPEKNPFLNLNDMRAGTMLRGYAITHQGITLGLTAEGVGDGFVWQKLAAKTVSSETRAEQPNLHDWETAPGSFRIESLKSGAGTILMDTGLTNMMLAIPDGPGKGDVPDGKTVTINLLNGQLHYSFKAADDTNPQTPRRVSWVRASHGIFVNTGLRALAGFDYLFDSDGGWLALRPLAPAH
jgi:hypothetical protein